MPLRETTFIARNRSTWEALERELAAERPDPDVLRDLYAAVSDDLSYARTHYPNRSVKTFLNAKAASLSLSLQRNQRRGIAVRKFFTETVPLELHTERRALYVAFAIFAAAFLIGWFSSVSDPDFARSILSDGYVDMTEANIADGDPMAVYKDGSMLGGALGITGNNLRVALLAFVTGVVYGAGTLFVMIYNGVMVGTFQHFFFARGVGWASVLGIWTHGTIEIACIIVSGAAGLVLARGIIWPGTLTRARSFQLSALSGLRIMGGIAPLIVLAGFIEGFLTRMTDLPTVLRAGFLLLNAGFVVYYFLVRPRQVGARVERAAADYGRLPPDRPLDWHVDDRPGVGETFFDAFRFFGGAGARFLGYGVALAVACVLLAVALAAALGSLDRDASSTLGYFGGVSEFAASLDPVTALLAGLAGVIGVSALTEAIHRRLPGPTDEVAGSRPPAVLRLCIPYALAAAAAYAEPILGLLTLPAVAVWARGITYDGSILRGLSNGLSYLFGSLTSFLALSLLWLLSYFTVALLYEVLVRRFALDFVALNFPAALDGLDVAAVLGFFADTALAVAFVLFAALAFGRYFASAREHRLASGLGRRLNAMFP